jgi:predicted oxidoreductase
MWKPENW